LGSCAGSTPLPLDRPALPAAPAEFGKPIDPPKVVVGASLKKTVLEQRAALHQANTRLQNDGAFYSGVKDKFGAE
jgi:hypothetical protein